MSAARSEWWKRLVLTARENRFQPSNIYYTPDFGIVNTCELRQKADPDNRGHSVVRVSLGQEELPNDAAQRLGGVVWPCTATIQDTLLLKKCKALRRIG